MRGFRVLSYLVFCLAITWAGCNKPSLVGEELLSSDQTAVGFTDTLTMKFRTVSDDSTFFYSDDSPSDFMLFGEMDDPVMGHTSASFYAEFAQINRLQEFLEPTAVIDSVILAIAYDTTNSYGILDVMHSIEVSRLVDRIDGATTYYAEQTFPTGDVVGSMNFEPVLTGSVDSILEPATSGTAYDTVSYQPHLRVPLDISVGEELLTYDSLTFTDDTLFQNAFKGFHFKATTNTNSLLIFDIESLVSGITIYYTVEDTLHYRYKLISGLDYVRLTSITHDHSTGPAGAFIEDMTGLGDSLAFCQGMAGPNIEVELPYISSLNGSVINHAELQLTLAELPGDDISIYEPLDRILISRRDDDGDLRVISDVNFALIKGDLDLFGGAPNDYVQQGTVVKKYTMNVSDYLQDLVEDTETNKFYLSTISKRSTPARVVVYGPSHSTFGAKLNITFSTPQ